MFVFIGDFARHPTRGPLAIQGFAPALKIARSRGRSGATMEEALPPDDRGHARVRVSVYVEVETDGSRRTGYLQDLSLGGFFLPCRPPLHVGERVRCQFFLAGPSADEVLSLGGRVARNTVLGCAIALDEIVERRARESLQRLMLAYAEDPAALEREFRRDETRRTGSD